MSTAIRKDRKTLRRTIAQWAGGFGYRLGIRVDPGRCIFLVSWMRSGSTLLSHLILDHPAVFGIGETHTRYTAFRSLVEAYLICAYFRRELPKNDALRFDKVLHNHLDARMPEALLENSRFILLTRKPADSYRSIKKMLTEHPDEKYPDPGEYLLDRVNRLAELRRTVPEDHLFVLDYEDIVDDTDRFRRLGDFLGFPIGRSYQRHAFTGRSGIGDYSETIQSGQIVRSTATYPELGELSPEEEATIREVERVVNDHLAP